MSIPFEIPARFVAGIAAKELLREGTTLRSVATGRIVAHLQETAALPGLASKLLSGAPPMQVAKLVADGIQIHQNEQIKAGIALLGNLQLANLALAGAGIGVSIAGFAILARKIDRIEAAIGDLAAAVARAAHRIERLHERFVRADLAALRAELRRIDEAWSRSDADAQWRTAADRLLTLEQLFHDHARALAEAGEEPALRDRMVDAFDLAAHARVAALLRRARRPRPSRRRSARPTRWRR